MSLEAFWRRFPGGSALLFGVEGLLVGGAGLMFRPLLVVGLLASDRIYIYIYIYISVAKRQTLASPRPTVSLGKYVRHIPALRPPYGGPTFHVSVKALIFLEHD